MSGAGMVMHTINPRLFPEQITYIINHAEDRLIFVDTTFVPMLEKIAKQIDRVEGFVILTDAANMPKTTLPNAIAYEEWLKEWDGEDTVTPRITTRVECAEWFPRRDEALLAHATQIDPTSRWFAVPLQLRQQINSTEDYELARSLVDTDLPEDDLFAGVRETINA